MENAAQQSSDASTEGRAGDEDLSSAKIGSKSRQTPLSRQIRACIAQMKEEEEVPSRAITVAKVARRLGISNREVTRSSARIPELKITLEKIEYAAGALRGENGIDPFRHEVAAFLGVTSASLNQWLRRAHKQGDEDRNWSDFGIRERDRGQTQWPGREELRVYAERLNTPDRQRDAIWTALHMGAKRELTALQVAVLCEAFRSREVRKEFLEGKLSRELGKSEVSLFRALRGSKEFLWQTDGVDSLVDTEFRRRLSEPPDDPLGSEAIKIAQKITRVLRREVSRNFFHEALESESFTPAMAELLRKGIANATLSAETKTADKSLSILLRLVELREEGLRPLISTVAAEMSHSIDFCMKQLESAAPYGAVHAVNSYLHERHRSTVERHAKRIVPDAIQDWPGVSRELHRVLPRISHSPSMRSDISNYFLSMARGIELPPIRVKQGSSEKRSREATTLERQQLAEIYYSFQTPYLNASAVGLHDERDREPLRARREDIHRFFRGRRSVIGGGRPALDILKAGSDSAGFERELMEPAQRAELDALSERVLTCKSLAEVHSQIELLTSRENLRLQRMVQSILDLRGEVRASREVLRGFSNYAQACDEKQIRNFSSSESVDELREIFLSARERGSPPADFVRALVAGAREVGHPARVLGDVFAQLSEVMPEGSFMGMIIELQSVADDPSLFTLLTGASDYAKRCYASFLHQRFPSLEVKDFRGKTFDEISRLERESAKGLEQRAEGLLEEFYSAYEVETVIRYFCKNAIQRGPGQGGFPLSTLIDISHDAVRDAVRRYDPDRYEAEGRAVASFKSYAVSCIRWAIQKEMTLAREKREKRGGSLVSLDSATEDKRSRHELIADPRSVRSSNHTDFRFAEVQRALPLLAEPERLLLGIEMEEDGEFTVHAMPRSFADLPSGSTILALEQGGTFDEVQASVLGKLKALLLSDYRVDIERYFNSRPGNIPKVTAAYRITDEGQIPLHRNVYLSGYESLAGKNVLVQLTDEEQVERDEWQIAVLVRSSTTDDVVGIHMVTRDSEGDFSVELIGFAEEQVTLGVRRDGP